MLLVVRVHKIVFSERHVGKLKQEAAAVLHHTPNLAQREQISLLVFERLERKNAIDRVIRERQRIAIHIDDNIASWDHVDIDKPSEGSHAATKMQLQTA